MGCSASSPFKDYYLGLERKKQCHCQCHKNGLESLGPQPTKPSGTPPKEGLESSVLDPRIPLTTRQIFLLQRSWRGISRNMSETGLNMFLSLFEKNKNALGYFTNLLSTSTLAELRESKTLENHVKGVMLTIDEAINNMDHADTIDMLHHVGKTHTRFKDFDPKVFLLIKDSFLLAVKDTLGDRYTAHMEVIYENTINFILNTLIDGFGGNQQGEPATARQKADGGREQENGHGPLGHNASQPGPSERK